MQIYFYADGSRSEFGTFASNTLGFLRGEFAGEFRRAIAAQTREAMVRKAEAGHGTGGRVYGYDIYADCQYVLECNWSDVQRVLDDLTCYTIH